MPKKILTIDDDRISSSTSRSLPTMAATCSASSVEEALSVSKRKGRSRRWTWKCPTNGGRVFTARCP
ncbi:MAG: hypothetical protein ACLSTO_05685 [Bilophila wadsworthia]